MCTLNGALSRKLLHRIVSESLSKHRVLVVQSIQERQLRNTAFLFASSLLSGDKLVPSLGLTIFEQFSNLLTPNRVHFNTLYLCKCCFVCDEKRARKS